MIITHLASGTPVHLNPDTKIKIERTNPFLNEYTEQSVPLDIPADDHNRFLFDLPDVFGRIKKMTISDVSIQDGEFFSVSRQAVLGATRKGMISTSFYLNDGSFYSRISKIKLKDIFTEQGDIIEFSGNTMADRVAAGIQFCRTLRNGSDSRFRIFPVLLEDDSGLDTGYNYKIMNAFGAVEDRRASSGFGDEPTTIQVFNPDKNGQGCDYYSSQERTEYVDTLPITTGAGYFMSPFIRTAYVLERVFSHFGYELQECVLTSSEPFTGMVIVNNVIDVLVNGRLRVADLLPDITVLDFLTLIRKKFCCEFEANDNTGKASVVFLRDVLSATPTDDITRCMTAEPTFNFKSEKEYKRIVLACEEKQTPEVSDSYDDIMSMVAANPQSYFSPSDGCFYKDGFSGNTLVHTKIGECSQDYNTGEDMEVQEVKTPDCMPELRKLTFSQQIEDDMATVNLGRYLYIGEYQTLNSKLETANTDEEMESSDSGKKAKTMLAFAYMSDGRPEGTLSNYDIYADGCPRLWDYSLFLNGDDGIFERFYRDYDLLLRNSLQEVKVKLLLSKSQKMNMSAVGKYIIRGVEFMIDKLSFVLGGKEEPTESTLRTVALTEPVSDAPALQDMQQDLNTGYVWVGRKTSVQVTESDYENAGPDKDRVFSTIYPPIPTEQMAGSRYGEQSSVYGEKIRHGSFWRHSRWRYTRLTTWLECVAADSEDGRESHYGGRR